MILEMYGISLVENRRGFYEAVGELKDMGFCVALNRYKSGETNQRSLFVLDYEFVAFDARDLYDRGQRDDLGTTILHNSMRMNNELGFKTLVRGIDDESRMLFLKKDNHVDMVEGGYYSGPVTQHELIAILKGTEMARREEQRAKAQNEAKSSFLANMSHEIRTPINAILGMNEMILRECRDKNITEYAKDISRAGNNLLALINDILDFSKIEAGSMEIVESDYDLSSVIHDVYHMMEVKTKDKGLELKTDIDPELPEKLYGDEMRFRQILINLLNNAVKYTNEGRVILRIKNAGRSADRAELLCEIEDTGIGIRSEDIGKLFGKFQRVNLEKNRTVEGTGLGLAITYSLLKMMGGTIDVTSAYGKGSLFAVKIPQRVRGDEPIGNFEERYRMAGNENAVYREHFTAPDANILVVDDTQINLTVVCALLKKTKMQIDTALSGEECLKLIGKKHYDIIFLDYRMPRMDGVETLHNMRKRHDHYNCNTPVIVLTANALSGAREEFMAEGFDDYMTKPVDGDRLEEMIMSYLPKDKIHEPLSTPEETEEDAGFAELLKEGGIDVDAALRYCGDKDVYEETLRSFCESYSLKSHEIKEAFESGNVKEYGILVHALKSSARLCGANLLSEKARFLEEGADNADMDLIKDKTGDLLKEYSAVISLMEGALGEKGDEVINTGKKTGADEELLNEMYERLGEAVLFADYTESCGIADEISSYELDKKEEEFLKSIRDNLEMMEWEKLKSLIKSRKEGT